METPDNPENQKTFLMLNRSILKVIKFQLLPPKRLGTVVKNIFFLGGGIKSPKSNGVKTIKMQNFRKFAFLFQRYDVIKFVFSRGNDSYPFDV